MKTQSKFLIFTMVLLIISLGALSASSVDSNDTSSDTSIKTNNIASDSTSSQNIQKNINEYSKTDVKKENKIVKSTDTKIKKTEARTHEVNSTNYKLYFQINKNTNLTETSSVIQNGDTINLQGTFTNVDFAVDKPNLVLTSVGKTARLYNSTVYVQGPKNSGSKVLNLTIANTNLYGTGIHINNSHNVTIANNSATVRGPFGFALAADNMNRSTIQRNFFETLQRYDTARTHTAVAIGSSYYNQILDNRVNSDMANGIYLSVYGSGRFLGGYSDNNLIKGNTVTGGNTSWSYTIQIMGKNNVIDGNNVSGGYRGISTQDNINNTIINNEVNGTSQGIYACEGAVVLNNTVHVNGTTNGITIGGDNAIIQGNTITGNYGPAIEISANKAQIINNTISTTKGYGIYSKGKYHTIFIDNNKINSGKEGILFKKQSSTKKINNVNVTRNVIVSLEAPYAINFEEAGAKNPADTKIYVAESNVLKSSRGSGLENAYAKPLTSTDDIGPDSNDVINVTQSNYNTYFDDEFTAKTSMKQNTTINLIGTFNNVDFIFNKKVHIIGKNCVINQGTITFIGDAHASTVTNVTIRNRNPGNINKHGIEIIEVNNCKITNVKIDNYDKYESFGIFIFSANGNTITNSEIKTSGDYINNAIFVYASDVNIIKNNKIDINQTNIPHEYDDIIQFDDRIGNIQEILHNHGIVLVYSSNNILDSNNITATSQFKSYVFPDNTVKNSIVGIDMYFDCHKNNVTNNNISITSFCPFSYGMGVLGGVWGSSITTLNASNNLFENNNVAVNGGYFATGFIAGRNSVNTTVKNNNFNVNAYKDSTRRGDYVYGITLENSTNSTILNNNVKSSGSALYNLELFDSSYNIIRNNTFNGVGTHPYGIAGYRTNDNKINNNTLILRKMNYGETNSAVHADAIPFGDEGIKLMYNSFRNTITENTIDTNASNSSVLLTEQCINNTVKENSLKSFSKIADASVTNNHKSNVVSNNFLHFVNINVDPIRATIGDEITFRAHVSSTTNDLRNITVTFKLGSNTIGSAKVVNGESTYKYNLSSLWRPTVYEIRAMASGTNFQNKTAINQANLNNTIIKTKVSVARVQKVPNSKVNLTANITDINGGRIGTGIAHFYLDKTYLGNSTVTLGQAAYIYKIKANAQSSVHNITVKYSGSNDYAPSEGSNKLGIQTKVLLSLANDTAKVGHSKVFTAKFTANGKPVARGKVAIKINYVTIGFANITNGVVKYNYVLPTTMGNYKYKLEFVYGGNDTLTGARNVSVLRVYPYNPVFHYNKTQAKVGEKVSLTVKIDNGTANNLFNAPRGTVGMKINGVTLKYSNGKAILAKVNNGRATFSFIAPAGLRGYQNITITYSGNSQFYEDRTTITNGLYIYDNRKVVNINADKSIYAGNPLLIKATVKDRNGKAVNGGNVKITINGVTAGSSAVKNGVATYIYQVPSSYNGNMVVKAIYINTSTSKADGDVSQTVSVKKPLANIMLTGPTSAKAGSKIALKTTSKSSNGATVTSGTIKYYFNNVLIKAVAVKNGVANYDYTVPSSYKGTYAIKASLLGSTGSVISEKIRTINII